MALLLLAPSDPERGKLGASVATSVTGQLAPPRSAPCATDTWCWDFRGRGGRLQPVWATSPAGGAAASPVPPALCSSRGPGRLAAEQIVSLVSGDPEAGR